jgi:hypothetical protein
MRGKKQFAVAMTAMSLAAAGGAIGAAGAQAQNEVLSGTATTTSGSWYCFGFGTGQQRSASVSFEGAGTATGPYAGPFSETGKASLHGNYGPVASGQLGISFAITSGTTTISGTITRNPLIGGVYCGGSIGYGGGEDIGAYTATIQTPGKSPQPISGAADLSGWLSTTSGSQDSLTAALTLP